MSLLLLSRDAPVLDPSDIAGEIAYYAAGGKGLDCNIPGSMQDLGTLIDGYQDAAGLVCSDGRAVDFKDLKGEINEGSLPLHRKFLVDQSVLMKIAQSLKYKN